MSKVSADVAYRAIRNKILTGKYAPGSALRSKRLAAEVGVSRTPIRDALRQLETDGLVVIRPRLGARVKELDLAELTDLCQMRLALEAYAAGLAAENHNQQELDELRAALAAMEGEAAKITRQPDEMDPIQAFQQEDLRFHLAVLTAARNVLIKNECTRIHLLDQVLSGKLVFDSLSDFYNWKDRLDQVANTVKEHHRMLDAIERGDAAAARAAMEEHLLPKVRRCIEAAKHDARRRQRISNNLKLIDR